MTDKNTDRPKNAEKKNIDEYSSVRLLAIALIAIYIALLASHF